MFKSKRGSLFSSMLALFVLVIIILISQSYFTNTQFEFLEFYFWPFIFLFCTIIIARLAKQISHAHFERASRKLRVFDKTRYTLFGRLISVIIWLIGIGFIIAWIPQLKAASVSLFAGAGVLAVIIGFAMQKTFSNLASGVFIATFQPYRIGDRLNIMNENGKVIDINLRHTVIETWDNRQLIIPNSKMDDEVIDNYTIGDPAILGTLDIGVSYDSDVALARKIMEEEVRMHPDFFDYDKHKELLASGDQVRVRTVGMTDSAVTLRLYFWTVNQTTFLKMRADLTERIKKRFDKEGVEIPYSYHTLVYKKDLPKTKHQGQAAIKKKSSKKKK